METKTVKVNIEIANREELLKKIEKTQEHLRAAAELLSWDLSKSLQFEVKRLPDTDSLSDDHDSEESS